MNRGLLAIVLAMFAVIVLHDVSMAIVGHPAESTNDATPEHAHHQDEAPAPEACETVRVQYLRIPDGELPASPVVGPSPAPSPVRWSAAAISDRYLIVSVLPPPSACLALFQAFLI